MVYFGNVNANWEIWLNFEVTILEFQFEALFRKWV